MANVTATTGWQIIQEVEPAGGFGSATIDAGSNRKLILIGVFESNTDAAPSSVAVGGQNPSQSIGPFFADITGSTDHRHYVWMWNEAAIAAMSGTAFSYTDATTSGGKIFIYGTVENTTQAALSGFADTDFSDSGNQLTLTTTSNLNDLVFITSRHDITTTTVTITGVTEIFDQLGTGFGTGNADSVVIDFSTTDAISAVAIVLPNQSVQSNAPRARFYEMLRNA